MRLRKMPLRQNFWAHANVFKATIIFETWQSWKFQLELSIGICLSTCIESSKLSLISKVSCFHFFVCLEDFAVHHCSSPATTAAFRPKTLRQQVYPAIFISTFKQALFPIGL